MLENNDPTELVLILSDINMPSMSRLELLRIVKVKYLELKVYMITAYDDEKNTFLQTLSIYPGHD